MAALKKSLGAASAIPKPAKEATVAPAKKAKPPATREDRRQPALKLPIEGGRKAPKQASPAPLPAAAQPPQTGRPRRKA